MPYIEKQLDHISVYLLGSSSVEPSSQLANYWKRVHNIEKKKYYNECEIEKKSVAKPNFHEQNAIARFLFQKSEALCLGSVLFDSMNSTIDSTSIKRLCQANINATLSFSCCFFLTAIE